MLKNLSENLFGNLKLLSRKISNKEGVKNRPIHCHSIQRWQHFNVFSKYSVILCCYALTMTDIVPILLDRIHWKIWLLVSVNKKIQNCFIFWIKSQKKIYKNCLVSIHTTIHNKTSYFSSFIVCKIKVWPLKVWFGLWYFSVLFWFVVIFFGFRAGLFGTYLPLGSTILTVLFCCLRSKNNCQFGRGPKIWKRPNGYTTHLQAIEKSPQRNCQHIAKIWYKELHTKHVRIMIKRVRVN